MKPWRVEACRAIGLAIALEKVMNELFGNLKNLGRMQVTRPFGPSQGTSCSTVGWP